MMFFSVVKKNATILRRSLSRSVFLRFRSQYPVTNSPIRISHHKFSYRKMMFFSAVKKTSSVLGRSISQLSHRNRTTMVMGFSTRSDSISEVSEPLQDSWNDHAYFVQLLEKKIKVAEATTVRYLVNPARIHASLVKKGIKSDQVYGKLLRLYGSASYTIAAERFFWDCYYSSSAGLGVYNSAIVTMGLGGEPLLAIQIFENIPRSLVKTQATYWNALVVCNHAGEIGYCHYILGRIFKVLAIEPRVEHLGTYIDALARNGQLEKACIQAKWSVYTPNHEIIVSILYCCRTNLPEESTLAREFVEYLEKRGVVYRLPKRLYEKLGESGVVWSSNVKILSQRNKGQSAIFTHKKPEGA